MLTIHLFTRAGDWLHEAQIPDPPDGDLPDVIMWGFRLFVVPALDNGLRHLADGDHAYIEAIVVQLPAPWYPVGQADAVGQS